MNSSPNKFDFFPVELHENLIFSLRLKDWDGVQEQLALAFAYLDKTKATVDNAFTGLMGLISLCLSYAIESGHSIAEMFGPGFSPYQELRRMATIEQCREWITGLYHRVVISSSGHRQSKSQKLYDEAKQFIQARYADHGLSVEGIAGHLYIDASYLRKIFSKEGDMSVSNYMTYIRMQKAKELIGSSELKLMGIAEQTGYNDANYFSKCFKKHFGVTPTEYEIMKRK
jgi:two-component system response regulator YesN